jgi:hypothetical protein
MQPCGSRPWGGQQPLCSDGGGGSVHWTACLTLENYSVASRQADQAPPPPRAPQHYLQTSIHTPGSSLRRVLENSLSQTFSRLELTPRARVVAIPTDEASQPTRLIEWLSDFNVEHEQSGLGAERLVVMLRRIL